MNRREKLFYAVSGFVLGNLLLATLVSGAAFLNRMSLRTSEVSFRQAASSFKNSVRRVSVSTYSAQSPGERLLIQLFRILFILFLISPPIMVVLLLVIIRKMDEKKSLE